MLVCSERERHRLTERIEEGGEGEGKVRQQIELIEKQNEGVKN